MTNTNKQNDDGEVTLVDFNDQSAGAIIGDFDLDHELEEPEELPILEPKPDLEELAPVEASTADILSSSVDADVKPPAESETHDSTAIPSITGQQLNLIKNLLFQIEDHAKQINDIIYPYVNQTQDFKLKISQPHVKSSDQDAEAQVIEGVFDGEQMIGPDGHQYNVPANYASKSRLVEGDMMKLTITSSGTFVYKQIEPIDRRRLTGILEETETGEYLVLADDRRWHVLSASISYYKGEAGDQVTIVIPKQGLSKWAAIENIMKR
jgi:hypothetical protein